jgi:hypothetical protein
VLAPTPPPDVDVDAWERSLDTVAGWSPERLALTHFGEVEDPARQLEACREALHREAREVGEQNCDAYVAALRAELRRRVPAEADTYERAVPPHHIWLGLDRWRSKRAEAAG